jgi:hypothetical protein
MKDTSGVDSPLQRKTRKGYKPMALLLEDVLTLYVFEHPEQEDDLGLVLSDQPCKKDPESLALHFKAYKSLYAFLTWCLAHKYITKSEYKPILKAYRSLVKNLCEKMNQGK